MAKKGASRSLVLAVLADHKPKSLRDVVEATMLNTGSAYNVLYRSWKRGLILRTKMPLYRYEKVFRGRAGMSGTTRPYHLYVLRPEGMDSVRVDGLEFVAYAKKYLDARGGGSKSKAQMILDFLEEHRDRAWFSTDIAESLKDKGVRVRDIMSNVRRFEEKGLVYVRGYKTDDHQTPFKRGYLITWLDSEKPREEAIEEAVRRTDRALADKVSSGPLMERIHRIRDIVIEHSKLRKIVSFTYLQNRLG